MSDTSKPNPDDVVKVKAYRDDPAWAELDRRGRRWFQMADADLNRLYLGETVAEFTDAFWDFDPESCRAHWEQEAGGPVILIY